MRLLAWCCIFLAVVLEGACVVNAPKHLETRLRQPTAALLVAAPAHEGIITGPEKTKQVVPEGLATYRVHHADSLSKATDGYLDWFIVVYWSSWLMLFLGFQLVTHLNGGVGFGHIECDEPRISRSSSRRSILTTKTNDASTPADSAPRRTLTRDQTTLEKLLGDDAGETTEKELDPNFWSLFVVSSVGRATDRQGNILSPRIVFTAALAMGLLQVFTLFLIVYDIDPSAVPYTETPSSPWKTSPLTVNCMKFVMVFFLGMSVVAEAGDAFTNLQIGMGVNEDELKISRSTLILVPCVHYTITLFVILAGVSVILSCQAVPDILYNSMAILFITQVDELFWNFWQETFETEADWVMDLTESADPTVVALKRLVVLFPMLLAFCLLGRAWYRDSMPALIVRLLAQHANAYHA